MTLPTPAVVQAPSDAEDGDKSSIWSGLHIGFFTDLGNSFLRSLGLLGSSKKRSRNEVEEEEESMDYSGDCCFGMNGKRFRQGFDDIDEE
ncbi:Uncharacterized protein FKW44_013808 [Caligus rogercresseyi]|uniref:Uncharacterized protein n=1 Tax=Caligus rogercresseyi TaxID=217165 RepID=A0A7T8GY37_CALRO|nr:Uncharacterized protein FKW44_013808 [Caligus rogercresseyi]